MVQYWIGQARTIDTLEEPEAAPAQWDSPALLTTTPEATRTTI